MATALAHQGDHRLHVVADGGIAYRLGRGPAGGVPRKLGLILAGDDPLAVDIVVAKLIGISPMKISQIRAAINNNMGASTNIKLIGIPLDSVKTKFRNPISPIQLLIDYLVNFGKRVGADQVV